MKTRAKALLGVGAVVFVLVAFGAVVITIMNAQAAQAAADREACILSLKQIDSAREKWALEHKDRAGLPITGREVNEIIRYLKDGQMPRCPANGAYWIDEAGKPICSCGDSLGHKLEGR